MTSPPAQKAGSPAPRSISALTAASFSQPGRTFSSSRIMPCVSAFSAFGRLSVITPSPSLTSNRISDSDIDSPYTPRYASSHQKPARNDHPHDLVGTFEDLVHAQVAEIALDGEVLQVAVAAMQLQRLVDDLKPDIGRETLAHRRGLRRLGRLGVEQESRPPDQDPRGVELGRHVGQLELRRLEFGDRLTELLALDYVARRGFEACASAAQRTGTDIDAPAIETGHGDLEAVALRSQPVGDRHLAVLEDHRSRRLAVPAALLFLLAEGKTGRSSLHDLRRAAARPLPAGPQHA